MSLNLIGMSFIKSPAYYSFFLVYDHTIGKCRLRLSIRLADMIYWIDDNILTNIDAVWRSIIYNPISKSAHFIRYRFNRDDQYHLVRCKRLKPGYYDIDERMLHSCFSLLESFYENELDQNSYTSEANTKIHEEIISLYKWWTITRPNRTGLYDKLLCRFDEEGISDPTSAEFAVDAAWTAEDTNNLIRLMKIRCFLWS